MLAGVKRCLWNGRESWPALCVTSYDNKDLKSPKANPTNNPTKKWANALDRQVSKGHIQMATHIWRETDAFPHPLSGSL